MTQATTGSPGRVLKTGVRRTVTREVVAGVPRIVKRYHAPGLLGRARDRFRARREHDALERLRARGLPVPGLIEVRRRDGYWELVLEDLSQTVTLEDALEGREAWPAPPLKVAAALGRLLAALVECDVRHGDLHAGNVLVDGEGNVHLIDLARVRVGATVAPVPLLVGCAAGLRERDPRGFRARALASFRRASGLAPDTESLEALSRARRRRVVERRVARYWRESGALRPVTRDGVRGLLARDLEEARLPELDRDTPPSGFVTLQAASVEHLTERWERAARCCMHRLPCERPVALIDAPRPRAVLAAPELAPVTTAASTSLGHTLGAIHDRGLRLTGRPQDLAVAPDGAVWIVGGELSPHDQIADIGWAREWFSCLGADADPDAVDAFLTASRGTAGERRRLAAAWSAHA